jgi:hypothetical protein
MFFEARIDPEEKKRLLDEIVFLDKNTDPSVFENICNKAKREFKGLIYPDGKVAVWNKSGWSGELHWEHVAVSERIHAAGVEKVKPLAAIYINVSDYEDPFVTFSSSNNSYFYPKYLRHHGDNNVSRKQSDIMFNALPTVDRIIYDNREVSRNEWEDENVSSNQLDIPFENNKTKIYSRTPSGPQTANMEQG